MDYVYTHKEQYLLNNENLVEMLYTLLDEAAFPIYEKMKSVLCENKNGVLNQSNNITGFYCLQPSFIEILYSAIIIICKVLYLSLYILD